MCPRPLTACVGGEKGSVAIDSPLAEGGYAWGWISCSTCVLAISHIWCCLPSASRGVERFFSVAMPIRYRIDMDSMVR